MASFYDAHKEVAKSEGGYTNNTKDKGNYVDGLLVGTNYGISAPILKAYLGRSIDMDDMLNLSPEVASDIYKQNYWNKIDGDSLKNQSVALMLYDAIVNRELIEVESGGKALIMTTDTVLSDMKDVVDGKLAFDSPDKTNQNNFAAKYSGKKILKEIKKQAKKNVSNDITLTKIKKTTQFGSNKGSGGGAVARWPAAGSQDPGPLGPA